jgi:hypothetical protein
MPIEGWENFYVIVGSSAGALIGLQFVVITLIAERPARGDAQAGSAFATPSVVHFSVVLLLSAIVSAPWKGIAIPALLFGLVGLGGIGYSFIVVRRMHTQRVYKPVFEDWTFHVVIPLAAYVMLGMAAWAAHSAVSTAMFVIGAAGLLLLFVGIHNAWDAVTYHVFIRSQKQE